MYNELLLLDSIDQITKSCHKKLKKSNYFQNFQNGLIKSTKIKSQILWFISINIYGYKSRYHITYSRLSRKSFIRNISRRYSQVYYEMEKILCCQFFIITTVQSSIQCFKDNTTNLYQRTDIIYMMLQLKCYTLFYESNNKLLKVPCSKFILNQ